MKANEAPDKIYMSPTGVVYKGDKQQCNDIEYVRIDTFIEKADKFISSFFLPCDTELKSDILDEFHKYMKGE